MEYTGIVVTLVACSLQNSVNFLLSISLSPSPSRSVRSLSQSFSIRKIKSWIVMAGKFARMIKLPHLHPPLWLQASRGFAAVSVCYHLIFQGLCKAMIGHGPSPHDVSVWICLGLQFQEPSISMPSNVWTWANYMVGGWQTTACFSNHS